VILEPKLVNVPYVLATGYLCSQRSDKRDEGIRVDNVDMPPAYLSGNAETTQHLAKEKCHAFRARLPVREPPRVGNDLMRQVFIVEVGRQRTLGGQQDTTRYPPLVTGNDRIEQRQLSPASLCRMRYEAYVHGRSRSALAERNRYSADAFW
jgi:hypothetical protein